MLFKKTLLRRISAIGAAAALLLFTAASAVGAMTPIESGDGSSFAMRIVCDDGKEVSFSARDFTRAFSQMGMDLRGIVVTSLPDPDFGRLTVGGAEVQVFDTIEKNRLGKLRFIPAGSAGSDSFTFRGFDSETFFDMPSTVTLSVDDAAFAVPQTGDLSAATFKNVSLTGRFKLNSYAAENCSLIVSELPRFGEISVNAVNNTFTYTPHLGKTGHDSFTYYAQDSDGNVSNPSTVSIDIGNSRSAVYYDDMDGHWAHNAAITLSEAGIIEGERIGAASFFHPDETVNRADFLMMLLSAAGTGAELPVCTETGLIDDADIAPYLKKYVGYALDNGIISGVATDDGPAFCADMPVTRAQAAQMINKVLKIPDARSRMKDYADRDEVPAWAQQSIINLDSNYILTGYDDNTVRPNSSITRAQCAQLLVQMMDWQKASQRESRSVFSFITDLFR